MQLLSLAVAFLAAVDVAFGAALNARAANHTAIAEVRRAAEPDLVARSTSHKFLFTNKCKHTVKPRLVDVSCGYSARCAGTGKFTAAQPKTLQPGGELAAYAPFAWVGRVFSDNGHCGSKGEGCTMIEVNLDTGSFYTPQAYDISNIQGYTQSIGVRASGCDEVQCTKATCPCSQAYPVGDMSGCGNDYPVRACGAGPVEFYVTFCP